MKICNPKIHRQKFLGKGDEIKNIDQLVAI